MILAILASLKKDLANCTSQIVLSALGVMQVRHFGLLSWNHSRCIV